MTSYYPLSGAEESRLIHQDDEVARADRLVALETEVMAYRAAVKNHEHCNAYDCGNCIGAIIAEVAEDMATARTDRPSAAAPDAGAPQENAGTMKAACLDCGLDYEQFGLDLLLPLWQWLTIHPADGGLLCANCIVKRASKLAGVVGLHAVIGCISPPSKEPEPEILTDAEPLKSVAPAAHQERTEPPTSAREFETLARFESPEYQQREWEGQPPSLKAIEAARAFFRYAWAVVPCVDGGVQLERHNLGFDMEITFDADGKCESVYAELAEGAPARAAEWQPLTTPEDGGDYPAESTLEAIKAWDPMRVNSLLAFVAKAWHWPEFGVSHTLRPEEAAVVGAEPGDVFLRLATGGWSGNEAIIAALRENHIASAFTWKLTASGGLHIYEYSKCQPDFPLPPCALTGNSKSEK